MVILRVLQRNIHGGDILAQKVRHEVRCFVCLKRMELAPEQKTVECPHCGQAWRITWVTPTMPKIRGRYYGSSSADGAKGGDTENAETDPQSWWDSFEGMVAGG